MLTQCLYYDALLLNKHNFLGLTLSSYRLEASAPCVHVPRLYFYTLTSSSTSYSPWSSAWDIFRSSTTWTRCSSGRAWLESSWACRAGACTCGSCASCFLALARATSGTLKTKTRTRRWGMPSNASSSSWRPFASTTSEARCKEVNNCNYNNVMIIVF